ncbi:hypothetical protein [Halorientalis sp.]|uniref:hypothetical protein n=1 Tax=Halorientalis sp. TaxID=1931229 RepID=UPI0026389EEF|nr:hypothetical protein [Halorientalis sp.]
MTVDALVSIANREADLFAGADDRLRSRLRGSERIGVDRYGIDQLTSILQARARWRLTESAVTTDQLRQVADAAAGDARVAISSFQGAVRRAQRTPAGPTPRRCTGATARPSTLQKPTAPSGTIPGRWFSTTCSPPRAPVATADTASSNPQPARTDAGTADPNPVTDRFISLTTN